VRTDVNCITHFSLLPAKLQVITFGKTAVRCGLNVYVVCEATGRWETLSRLRCERGREEFNLVRSLLLKTIKGFFRGIQRTSKD
jgi:hypothetical protein